MQVVELAPAYGLDDKVRQALHADALKIARHVNYRNAGTVEFMVDKNGDYYFLEVNPRIQVTALHIKLLQTISWASWDGDKTNSSGLLSMLLDIM